MHYRLFAALLSAALIAATPHTAPKPHPSANPTADERSSVTHHSIAIGGQTIAYTATAGTLVITNDKKQPEASVFYVAYTKDGVAHADRPVTFLYNGGPGCASSPLHMLAFGPRRIAVGNGVANAPAPARLVDNADTLLDQSDLVFIDAPGTGYSRLMPKTDPKTIYGIDQDAAAFAQFIRRYVTLNDRWNSPRFLLGESYGTPRSAALVDYLQNRETMGFSGVILLSSVLDFDTIAPGPGNDLAYVAFLPSYAATHWYHSPTASRGTLESTIDAARAFANGPYASALMQGDRLSRDQFTKIASEYARLTGLSQNYVEQSGLRVQPQRFMKELLRGSGEQTGRLDARYRGYDLDRVSDSQEFDPADAYVSSTLQSGFLSYARNELHWKSDEAYPQCGNDIFPQWDFTRKSVFGWIAPTTSPDLQDAMTQNPQLKVFVGGGWYDLATPPGAAEWTFAHLNLPQQLRSNVTMRFYQSGHMVYLNPAALTQFHHDLVEFYGSTRR